MMNHVIFTKLAVKQQRINKLNTFTPSLYTINEKNNFNHISYRY